MSLTATDIQFLQDLLSQRSGHVISDQQSYLFDTRLESVVLLEGLKSVTDLVNEVRRFNSIRLTDQITEAMTINETFFNRDVHPFETLREDVLPELMNSRRDSRKLSIWAGACSSGQEPYSIAMVIRHHFPELNDWHIRILATDISDDILAKAEKGEYSQFEVNRGLDTELLASHFDRHGETWIVKDEIREMTEFRKVNLTNPWPIFEKFDIVFLRNVLIYFSRETKESILRRLRTVIADDGFLFLGGGELTLRLDVPFQRQQLGQSVCFRPIS